MNCWHSSGVSNEFQRFHLFQSFSSNYPWLQWNSTGILPEWWKDFLVGKNKNKKYFCKSCLQCFSCKNVLTKHKELCLSINGAQSVRFEKEQLSLNIILNKYQSHLKSMLILSVIYRVLRVVKVLTQKNIKITFLAVLLTNFFVLMNNLANQ